MDQEHPEGLLTPPSVHKRTWRSRRLGAVLAVAAMIVLTIGGSAASAASPSPTVGRGQAAVEVAADPGAAAADDAFSKFAACMRDHGIAMSGPTTITVAAGADGPLPAIPDGGASSGLIVSSGTAQLVGGSGTAPAVDPQLEAANTACVPILEKAGIGAASSNSSGSGTLVIGGSGGAALPALEGFPKP